MANAREGALSEAGPRLSVVVAAWNGPDALRSCLAGLRSQRVGDLETIVARNFALEPPDDPVRTIPRLVDLPLPSTMTVPRLRAAGLARARGGVVAFIEDHAVCAPGWAAAILEAHAGPYAAVGGPVERAAGGRLVDWAGYFAEYGRFVPPCRSGAVSDLPGLNMSFKRTFLESASAHLADGVFEAVLQRRLRADGGILYLATGATITDAKRYEAVLTARQMLHLGRGFGAERRASWGWFRRLARAAVAPLVPGLLAARVAQAVVRAGRARGAFVAALPWTLVFLSAWAVGEATGYIGGAGDSDAKWR